MFESLHLSQCWQFYTEFKNDQIKKSNKKDQINQPKNESFKFRVKEFKRNVTFLYALIMIRISFHYVFKVRSRLTGAINARNVAPYRMNGLNVYVIYARSIRKS